MPMKKIHVEFVLDAEVFMKMLQHGNSGMKIDVYGDTPKTKKEDRKLLPAPERKGAKVLMLDYIIKHQPVEAKAVTAMIIENGYASGTSSSQLHLLLKQKLIRRVRGKYIATEKAVSHG
jgi:hypothetical protein